jgi:transcriptional regulator with XRE-family HTH domain
MKLLKKGMSIEDISDATGLSKQQIKELQKQ